MSCKDGSRTIWKHFSSFVTYIIAIFDFRFTLIIEEPNLRNMLTDCDTCIHLLNYFGRNKPSTTGYTTIFYMHIVASLDLEKDIYKRIMYGRYPKMLTYHLIITLIVT